MPSLDNLQIRLLAEHDSAVLERVAPDVFDHAIRPELAREFLADPRHHLAVAIVDSTVIGFASGVHYLHPDKPPELFVNEVGVAPPWQRRGIGKPVIRVLLDHAKSLGCRSAWVATEPDNSAARALYGSAGGVEDTMRYVIYEFAISS
ncbi:MAG: GNAT family N-acetyltransferase [Acidobacteriota bacterium]